MWDILAWIVMGGLAGVAATLTAQDNAIGLMLNIMIGVVGASLGGALLTPLQPTSSEVNGVNAPSLIVAIAGAVLLLGIMRALLAPRRTTAQ